ncbi:MAG: hypothetical protein AB7T10_05800 [bacterium]
MDALFFLLFFVFTFFSLVYMFKQTTWFNKKASMVFMVLSVISLLLYMLSALIIDMFVAYYIIQSLILGFVLFSKTLPYLFQREDAEKDEDS